MEHESEKLAREIPAWAEAKKYGIDIAMLYDNLQLTPTERIKQHQISLNMYNKFSSKPKQKNLIESKKAMGRPRDIEAVKQLEAIETKYEEEQ